ncbi:MurR/RpiR family transcriptional regulator [Alkalihalobacillus sp. CinArs1]|uniref:MurR/RpiR family transcriptional regulator n=1 Tax=Alkalihalobacillus sp. CinArs1 TaxID=2995314 RepID=UPI0022DD2AF7|nr:MurR/RpiR family transcriptional regulator [Alkalihalobacillus sp. CinArs1]
MSSTETRHCLPRIRSSYSQFSEKERQVADYILNHSSKIIHSTINQVAEDLGVADATVFRFCKRIGFKGFQAMKIALAAEIVNPIQDIHETISETDSKKDIAEKVLRSNIRTLEDTLHILENSSIENAVEALLKADRIEFYGNGGSGIIAMDAQHKFIRTGLRTAAYSDAHLQIMSASQLTESDLAILISHSGTNKDMIRVADIANESGATTIAITNLATSPLSKKADISLYTVSQETEFRSEAFASRIAQLSLVDALYVNVMIARKEKAKDSLQRMREAISTKRL